MDEVLTRGQKASRTAREKRERHEKEVAEAKRERELLHNTLTAILESDTATPTDKVEAARLLMELDKG